MTIEEKAKAYDEALERARDFMNGEVHYELKMGENIMCWIFPELRESEDEGIRKEIITHCRNTRCVTEEGAEKIAKWIAWLEKQGKQKSVDKAKPKESEDEIIPDKNETRDIEQNLAGNDEKIRKAIICGMYALKEQHRRYFASIPIDDVIAWLEKQGTSYTTKDVVESYIKGLNDAKNEIEKQNKENYQIRKDIATFIFNYKGDIKDRAKWMDFLGVKVYVFENEDEKPQGKSALEAIKEEKVDNANKNISKFKAEDWYVSKVDGKIHNIHSDNVEPKFNIGDWITNKGHSYLIAAIEDDRYLFEIGGYTHEQLNWEYIKNADEKYHLWTIKDAKNGDVLYSKKHNLIWIYKDNKHYYASINLNYADVVSFDNEIVIPSDVCPANRIQKSILFQKMEEAGYKWDADKKELKLLITNGGDF